MRAAKKVKRGPVPRESSSYQYNWGVMAAEHDFESSNDDRFRACTSASFHVSQATTITTAPEEAARLISGSPQLSVRRESRREKEKMRIFVGVSFLTIIYATAYFTYLILLPS